MEELKAKINETYHVLSRAALIHSILHPHLCQESQSVVLSYFCLRGVGQTPVLDTVWLYSCQWCSGVSVSKELVRYLDWGLSVSIAAS